MNKNKAEMGRNNKKKREKDTKIGMVAIRSAKGTDVDDFFFGKRILDFITNRG